MISFLFQHKKILSFVLGAIGSFSFAPYYFLPAAVVSFSVLLYLILIAKSKKQAFVTGYLFGFAHFAFGLSWIGNALLIEPETFGWLYPFAVGGLGAFFGLFFALPAVLTSCACRPWQKWLVFCSSVVIGEWLRSFLLTGFPWNLTGYSLAFSQTLIQVAAYGGTYFLSLLSLLAYSVFGLCLQNVNRKSFWRASLIFSSFFAFLFISGMLRLSFADDVETETLIEIVQPSIPQKMKWSKESLDKNFSLYTTLSASYDAENRPDFIIWGETASPFVLDIDEEHRLLAASILPEKGYLITGSVSYQPVMGKYRPHNSLLVLDHQGNIVDYYHKSHLVPFGEYIPLRDYLPSFIRPIANAIGSFGQGNGPKVITLEGKPSFGGIICYEVIFPHEIVNIKNRPDFLINLTNDGWYGNSAGPYQHWAAAKLRAVEEGIPLVRVANNGISGVFSAYGAEKGVMALNEKGIRLVRLPNSLLKATFYEKFGHRGILTFCLILMFLGFIRKRGCLA